MSVQLYPRIVADPATQDGKPVIEGTQVRAGAVLEQIAAGKSIEQAARDLAVTVADARAVLAYSAQRLDEAAVPDPLLALVGIIDSRKPGWADDHDRLFGTAWSRCPGAGSPRSFAWMARFRRLARDNERPPQLVAGLRLVAFARLLLHRAGLTTAI